MGTIISIAGLIFGGIIAVILLSILFSMIFEKDVTSVDFKKADKDILMNGISKEAREIYLALRDSYNENAEYLFSYKDKGIYDSNNVIIYFGAEENELRVLEDLDFIVYRKKGKEIMLLQVIQ